MGTTRLGILALMTVLLQLAGGCGLVEGRCRPGDFRVGLVTDTAGIYDASLNENTWKGLQKAEDELGVCAQFLESRAGADYGKDITEFAEQGFGLVVTVGSPMVDTTVAKAEQYADTSFVIVDNTYDPLGSNVLGMIFRMEEVTFPAGYLAAAWADLRDPDDPQVGWVADESVQQVEHFIAAYEGGVAYYNAGSGGEVQVKGEYVSHVEGADEGRIRGDMLIDSGVDVILGVGGDIGDGALTAAKERGKWGIGASEDQYYTLPEVQDILLTSCVKRPDRAVYSVVEAAVHGGLGGGGTYLGTLMNGGVSLAPFHDFESEIPDSLRSALEEIQGSIIDGDIKVGP